MRNGEILYEQRHQSVLDAILQVGIWIGEGRLGAEECDCRQFRNLGRCEHTEGGGK